MMAELAVTGDCTCDSLLAVLFVPAGVPRIAGQRRGPDDRLQCGANWQ